jgi:hypothetical protein
MTIEYQSPGAYFRVRDYGATGDGTTDDTAAIQAAITACQDAGGGIVWLDAGRYKVAGTLAITHSGVRVLGAGIGCTIILKASTTADLFHCVPATLPTNHDMPGLDFVEFRDFTVLPFSPTTPHTGGWAFYLKFCFQALIEDVVIGEYLLRQPNQSDSTATPPICIWGGVFLDLMGESVLSRCRIYTRMVGVRFTGSYLGFPTGTSGKFRYTFAGNVNDCVIYNQFVPGSIGVHLAGGTGGAYFRGTDVGAWERGLVIDKSLVNESNREVFMGPGFFLDSSGNHGCEIMADSLLHFHAVDFWGAGEGQMAGYTGGHPYGYGLVCHAMTQSFRGIITGGRSYANKGGGLWLQAAELWTVSNFQCTDNNQGGGAGGADLPLEVGLAKYQISGHFPVIVNNAGTGASKVLNTIS